MNFNFSVVEVDLELAISPKLIVVVVLVAFTVDSERVSAIICERDAHRFPDDVTIAMVDDSAAIS